METNKLEIPREVHYEINRALIGEINPSLIGVAFDWDEKSKFIFIFFYHTGNLTDALEDHYSCIDNEASNRFFFNNELIDHDFKVVNWTGKGKFPKHDYWVFLRKEPFEDPIY